MDEILTSITGKEIKFWNKYLPREVDQELKYIEKANLDQIVEEGKSHYETLNAKMAEKYPSFKKMLEDPEKFKAEMVARFEKQKKLGLVERHGRFNSNYAFDYSDVAGPELKWMEEQIPLKIDQMNKLKSKLSSKLITKLGLKKSELASYDLAIQYLEDLQKELKSYLPNGVPKIDYASYIEYTYYFSRAMGIKENSLIPFIWRSFLRIDEALDGFKEYSVAKEYELYRARRYELYPEKLMSKGYTAAKDVFEKTFFDEDHLRMVIIPTHQSLDRDIFDRLMPYDVAFFGMLREPFHSEGFIRPGGRFYVHDLRHESGKVYETQKYIENYQLTEKQVTAFKAKMDTWQIQLNKKIEAVEDLEFKNAIKFMVFNNHHDRGMPLVPSSYFINKPDIVPFALYSMMRGGGQGVDFKRPVKNLFKAQDWLSVFWRSKLDEELSIIRAK